MLSLFVERSRDDIIPLVNHGKYNRADFADRRRKVAFPLSLAYAYAPRTEYCLVMWDNDAPSAEDPTASPFLHWVVANITKRGTGVTLVDYAPPDPPSRYTSAHRYTVALYAQNARKPVELSGPGGNDAVERANFDVDAFAKDNALTEVARVEFFVKPTGTRLRSPPASSAANTASSHTRARSRSRSSSSSSSPPPSSSSSSSSPSSRARSASRSYSPSRVHAFGSVSHQAPAFEDMTEKQKEYCGCLINLFGDNVRNAEQGRPEATVPHAACKERVGDWALCGHYYKAVVPECGDHDLQGYAAMKGIPIPRPYKRSTLMRRIRKFWRDKDTLERALYHRDALETATT